LYVFRRIYILIRILVLSMNFAFVGASMLLYIKLTTIMMNLRIIRNIPIIIIVCESINCCKNTFAEKFYNKKEKK